MNEAPQMIQSASDARARIVQDFSRNARTAVAPTRLREALCEAVRALGFHHVLLQQAGGAVWLADMPVGWRAGPDAADDAVLAAAPQTYAPFLWSDIPRLAALSPAQRKFLDGAMAAGIGAALAVPIHRPHGAAEAGGYSVFAGCCSFVMKTGVSLPLASLAAAHYVGAMAFDVAERLRGAPVVPAVMGAGAPPRLTPRQRDCVVLAAQGKSDWEIGQLLGISESTVHKHIEDAKRRFGVCTRIQLVVRSLFDAKLSFSDIMK
jgi:LuxR family quorum-sensing system transcriptional regulator CciR